MVMIFLQTWWINEWQINKSGPVLERVCSICWN